MEDISAQERLALPRWITGMTNSSELCLHVFADASENAYGAVAYIVVESPDKSLPTFVIDKCQVVASKQ